MRAKVLYLAAALALAGATANPVLAAGWNGDAEHARMLIAERYKSNKVQAPEVADTGREFRAGGVMWRVYRVSWPAGGFRHVAVHRQKNGEYLAIEGLEKDRKWSHGVPIGR